MCDAWVEASNRFYICDKPVDGHVEHANTEGNFRWRGPIRQRNAPGRRHGIPSTYDAGCRCDECTVAVRPKRKRRLDRVQSATKAKASRHRYEWTGPELEIASRTDLTAREVAYMLGRTFGAVKTMRWKLNHEPREQALAGVSYQAEEEK